MKLQFGGNRPEFTAEQLLPDKFIKMVVVSCFFLVLLVGIWYWYRLSLPHFTSSSVKFESLPNYDKSSNGTVFSNLAGENCDIFITGPSGEVKYYKSFACSSLDKSSINRNEILSLFSGRAGSYKIMVHSDQAEGYYWDFEVR